MYRKIIFFTLLLSLQFIHAQENQKAEQILNDLLTLVKKNAIKTNFKLTVYQKNQPQSTTGTFTLKVSKFYLEMSAMKVWFDGKTQWSYLIENNEVSITEPSQKELSETNPMAILSGYKTKCSIRFSKLKSEQNYCIEMLPLKTTDEITKIDVQVNKTTGNLFSIRVTNKNGNNSLLTLSNFQKGIVANDNLFEYIPSHHKGVIINDLR